MSRIGGAGCALLSTLALTAVLTVTTSVQTYAAETVRITNGEWTPYLGKDEPHYGIASRIVTAAFEEVGMEVEYGFFPWSRSLFLAERGDWDGSAVWFTSDARRDSFHVSDPVIVSEYVFFHRRDLAFDWEEAPDLESYQVGITRNYDYGSMLSEAEETGIISTETVSSDELNFQKLAAGRIDLFPVDRVVGLHMIRSELTDEQAGMLTWHPRPVRREGLHLLLSREVPGNEQRMEAFNEGLKTLREENRIEHFLVDALGELFNPGFLESAPLTEPPESGQSQ